MTTPPNHQEQPNKPSEKDEQPDEGEDDAELSDTNYNISSIVFPIHRNAGLSETITIYPDENNLFTERVYSVRYDHTRPYMMPASLSKLYIEFNSDAKTIYIDGVEYKKNTPYDFSKPVTVTACADTGTEKSYTIELKNFTGLPIIYINTASGQEVKDKENYEDATIEIIGSESLPGLAKMDMQIHGRGNVSWTAFTKKQSYTISLSSKQKVLGMPKHKKVCHGDFNPSNIIITEDGTPYILDWSHATQGNASADAARTYLLFWLNGDIEGAKKYLDLFCEKSNTAKQYVQKWMPIVAASQSVKGNEHEREFLLSWVNVVDYE